MTVLTQRLRPRTALRPVGLTAVALLTACSPVDNDSPSKLGGSRARASAPDRSRVWQIKSLGEAEDLLNGELAHELVVLPSGAIDQPYWALRGVQCGEAVTRAQVAKFNYMDIPDIENVEPNRRLSDLVRDHNRRVLNSDQMPDAWNCRLSDGDLIEGP